MQKRASVGLAVSGVALTVLLAGCGDGGGSTQASSQSGSCATTPVDVVVTVSQWGDIVESLGGDCVSVDTIVTAKSGDPHDYEPTAADNALFEKAKLVVENGVDYDHWAEKAVDTVKEKPTVLSAGEVVGVAEGQNPHLWYSPDYVVQVSDAITKELSQLAPEAADYFKQQRSQWDTDLKPYHDEIAAIKKDHEGRSYAATETVFDYMGTAVGLKDLTPQGYQNASKNESDPTAADISTFEQDLKNKKIDVLVYNTQTDDDTAKALQSTANTAGVPVVDVTESVPEGQSSFVDWQVGQLKKLNEALSTKS